MDEEKNDEQAQERLEQTLPIVLRAQDDTAPLLEQLARIAKKEVGERRSLGFFDPDEFPIAHLKSEIEAERAIWPKPDSAQSYLDKLLGTSLKERNRLLYGMFLPPHSTFASSEDELPAQTVSAVSQAQDEPALTFSLTLEQMAQVMKEMQEQEPPSVADSLRRGDYSRAVQTQHQYQSLEGPVDEPVVYDEVTAFTLADMYTVLERYRRYCSSHARITELPNGNTVGEIVLEKTPELELPPEAS